MEKAYLRKLEHSEQFQLSFQYIDVVCDIDRQFNFCRQLKESVNVFLRRISINVEKFLNKRNKKKKRKGAIYTNITAQLYQNNIQVNGDTICKEVFKDGCNDITLKLLNNQYQVVINTPCIDGVALPSLILANFPTYPTKLKAVYTDQSLSEFTWYKSEDKINWSVVGSGFIYVPSNNLINCYLKLVCTPKNGSLVGPTIETISETKVQAGPGHCPFENRHQLTKKRAIDKEFRIVSYNILADKYCDKSFTRGRLFKYCPSHALNIEYRIQLILKELIGYNADVICLQELGTKVFINDVQPVFTSLNYNCKLQLNGGLVPEGIGCIFNVKRFRHLESSHIVFSEQINTNPLFADIWEKVSKNKRLSQRILNRTTTLQTTALESLEHDEVLLVANTHLYFEAYANHVRLLQGCLAIRFITDVMEKLKQKTTKRISLIFCGDFNSLPESGIHTLFTKGSICEDCIDWRSTLNEAVEGVNFQQPLQLESACGTPPYTNYAAGFSGCLDYIYYDKSNIGVFQVIPLPTHEEVTKHTALPSVVFPSDRLSLAADLKFL